MKKPNGWIAYETLSSYTLYRLMNDYKEAGEEIMHRYIRAILLDRDYID